MPMPSLKSSLLAAGLALAVVAGGGIATAAVVGHNQVASFGNSAPSHFFTFQPYLRVESGCVPFPAVDAAGNTNGGLSASGARNGGCSSSSGQVYARQGSHNGECAIMYAWYFPKDQVIDGHRHDWEYAVVWLSSCSTNGTVRAVSYSSHSGFEKTTTPPLSGKRPKVRYWTDGFTNHRLGSTNTQGGSQPMIDWNALPQAARNALNTTNFGSAVVPIKDSNFANNLQRAYYR